MRSQAMCSLNWRGEAHPEQFETGHVSGYAHMEVVGESAIMTKMLCPCGEVITMSGLMPNPLEWLLISDSEYDEYQGTIDAESLYLAMLHAFRCPKSGHLFVYWDGLGEQATVYEPTGKVD